MLPREGWGSWGRGAGSKSTGTCVRNQPVLVIYLSVSSSKTLGQEEVEVLHDYPYHLFHFHAPSSGPPVSASWACT